MFDNLVEFDYDSKLFADMYDELPLWSAPFGQLLLEHLPLQPQTSLLDIGCGTGFPLLELGSRLGQSSHVVGLDVWQSALTRTIKKRNYFDRHHISIVPYSGTNFPFRHSTFDTITSNLGVNNFSHPQHAVAECYRVTKSGGRIAITTNLIGHMAEFYTIFRTVLTDFGNTNYVDSLNHQEAHRGTIDTHSQLLIDGGYQIDIVVEREYIMRYANGSALFQHPFIRFGFLPAWGNLIPENDRQAVFTQLEDRINAHSNEQGELRLTIPMVYISGIKS